MKFLAVILLVLVSLTFMSGCFFEPPNNSSGGSGEGSDNQFPKRKEPYVWYVVVPLLALSYILVRPSLRFVSFVPMAFLFMFCCTDCRGGIGNGLIPPADFGCGMIIAGILVLLVFTVFEIRRLYNSRRLYAVSIRQ